MRHELPYASIKPYLPHALAVTLGVYGVPVAASVWIVASSEKTASVLIAVVLSLLLTSVITAAGSFLWSRTPESADISFGELVIWRWLQRRHAENRLAEDTRLLGLDAAGNPIARPRIEPPEQVRTLRDLSAALEAKDIYTHGHSRRVEKHVRKTAEALGLAAADIEELCEAAALHDVGKIRVPDRVLRKPGVLTSEEKRKFIEQHALVGASMVAALGAPNIALAVRNHHERWDGKGYPDGLAGRNIPLFSRIIAVADAYDAMTSTRPYRPALSHDRALQVLRQESGRQFDFEVVEAFIATVRVPITAALGLVAVPWKLVRELAVPAKRVGAASLAPAAGAVGGAAVLSAAVLVPPAPPARPIAPHRERAQVATLQPARASAARQAARSRLRTPARPGSLTAGLGAKPPAVPDPLSEPSGQKLEPKEDVGVGSGRVERPAAGDPRPDRGRDCVDHPGKGQGGGNARHCNPVEGPAPARADRRPDKGRDCVERRGWGRARGYARHCASEASADSSSDPLAGP